jgi:26S proteasome regulatory subunit N5
VAAADIIQEVHVETYGSLSKKDKVEFILEQIRLVLAKKDFVRAYIVAGKVSRKHLQEETMEEYKVRFFTLLAQYHRHEKDAFELAKDYHAIYSTPHILANEDPWKEALQATVLFLCLSEYGNEQQDLMHKIALDTNLEKLPACKMAVDLFLKKEIINYPMAPQAALEALPVFALDDLGGHWHEIFHRRIIQHNIRVVSGYYQRIRATRLAQLLQLEPERLEKEIADMVSDGAVYAKIDRPKDIIRFAAPKSSEAILSEWAADIDKVLHLVETTAHLIHKENMTAAN